MRDIRIHCDQDNTVPTVLFLNVSLWNDDSGFLGVSDGLTRGVAIVEVGDRVGLSPMLLSDLGVHNKGPSDLVEDDASIAFVDDAEDKFGDDIVLHCNHPVVAYSLRKHDEATTILGE